MELSRRLHFREANTTSSLESLAVNDNFFDRAVVLVEFRQRTDHLVHHGTVESLGLARLQTLTHFSHAFLNLSTFFLSGCAASRA